MFNFIYSFVGQLQNLYRLGVYEKSYTDIFLLITTTTIGKDLFHINLWDDNALEEIRSAINAGADVNARDKSDYTMLMYARGFMPNYLVRNIHPAPIISSANLLGILHKRLL